MAAGRGENFAHISRTVFTLHLLVYQYVLHIYWPCFLLKIQQLELLNLKQCGNNCTYLTLVYSKCGRSPQDLFRFLPRVTLHEKRFQVPVKFLPKELYVRCWSQGGHLPLCRCTTGHYGGTLQ